MQWTSRHTTAFIAFAALAALAYACAPEGLHTSSDAAGYIWPANALLEGKGFISQYRLPGYPLLLCIFYALPVNPVPCVVAFQAMLLFFTGLLVHDIVAGVDKRAAMPALLLTIFNPVAFFYVQRLVPETVFTALLLLHVYGLVRGMSTRRPGWFVLAALAAASLLAIRANGLHIVLVSAAALPWAIRSLRPFPMRNYGVYLLALLLFTLGVTGFNYAIRGDMVSSRYMDFAVHDNLVFLEQRAEGLDSADSARITLHERAASLLGMAKQDWDALSRPEQFSAVASVKWRLVAHYPPIAVVKAVAKVSVLYLMDGGVSLWTSFLQVPQVGLSSLFSPAHADGAYFGNLCLYVLLLGFTAATRLLLVPGVLSSRSGEAAALLKLAACYFLTTMAAAAFLGYARYRLPTDPLLLAFAALGWTNGFKRRNNPIP